MPKPAKQVKLYILSGAHAGAYSTYVDDVSPRGLVLAVPMAGQAPVPLPIGEMVKCEHHVPGQARISFFTTVKSRQQGVMPTVTLAIPTEVDREQERSFVRLPATLQAVFMIETRPDEVEVDGAPVKSRTADVSGNGAMIWSPENLPKGTMIRLLVELTNPRYRIDLMAQVVRTVKEEADASVGGFWLGLQYEIIPEKDREAVIRYIFNEQRDRKKRGLLN